MTDTTQHYVAEKSVPVPEFRPSFRKNKAKTLVFYDLKQDFSAGYRENWVYVFGHWKSATKICSEGNFLDPKIFGLFSLTVIFSLVQMKGLKVEGYSMIWIKVV
jgi:hypothetical protein